MPAPPGPLARWPATSSGKATLVSAVRHGRRRGSWKTSPTRGSGPSTGRPSTSTLPSAAGSSPAMTRSRVLLPQPLGPTRATTDRRSISRSIPSRTGTVRPSIGEREAQAGEADRGRGGRWRVGHGLLDGRERARRRRAGPSPSSLHPGAPRRRHVRRAWKRPKGPTTRSQRPPCGGLATLAGGCGTPCGAPPALASRPDALRHRCDRRTASPPLRKGRPPLRRARLPLRGARPPCGGTAVRSSRPLRADRMIARRRPCGTRGSVHEIRAVSAWLSTARPRSRLAAAWTKRPQGETAGQEAAPPPFSGRGRPRRSAGPDVRRGGAGTRRWGRTRRRCGRRGGAWSGTRWCRSRGVGRRPGDAVDGARRRFARRARGARRVAAPGRAWTSCPVGVLSWHRPG